MPLQLLWTLSAYETNSVFHGHPRVALFDFEIFNSWIQCHSSDLELLIYACES